MSHLPDSPSTEAPFPSRSRLSRKRFLQSLGLVAAGTALPAVAVRAAGATAYPFALREVGGWSGRHIRACYAEAVVTARALGISARHAEAAFTPVRILRRDADGLEAEMSSGQIMTVERRGGKALVRFRTPD